MAQSNSIIKLKSWCKNWLHNLGYEVRASHVNPFEDQSKILQPLSEVKIIFDLGANIGQTIEKYQIQFPQATIYAFEPSQDAFTTLSSQYQADPRVKTYQLAVSQKTGKEKFFLNYDNVMNSLLSVADSATTYLHSYQTKNVDCVEVATTSINEFCSPENLQDIDILKMDIQGGEIMALQGASDLLSKQAIRLIYTEVLFAKLYDQQANFYQIANFLESYGYRLYGLYDLHYGSNGTLGWGDAIFVSPEVEASLPKAW